MVEDGNAFHIHVLTGLADSLQSWQNIFKNHKTHVGLQETKQSNNEKEEQC